MEVLDDLRAALDGRYEIVRELGRGGMAVVYLARDLKHDRQVALKVLPAELAGTVGADRFVREIRTAAQLSHPNILPLHDSIAVDQVRAYVMPYVQGESLRQRLDRERQFGIDQAVDLARQIAAGLDYAHAQGVVHRDIKPENILLIGDQAVIADFGLARALFAASSAPFTESGIAVGTPAYMSPEQAAGERTVDGRTDVYALGCLFFEMVAGVPPFRGATVAALLAAHATRKPPSLCEERESCPPAMDAAVQRALAKVPADRFRTAGEFVRALETWRASAGPAAVHGGGRRRLLWAAGGAAVVAAAITVPRLAERAASTRIPVDSMRIVVGFADGEGGPASTNFLHHEVCGALQHWRDLAADGCEPAHVAFAQDANLLQRQARRSGAARFVLASLGHADGDSVSVTAALYARSGAVERQATVRLPVSRVGDDLSASALALALFREFPAPDDADDGARGTTSLRAWHAYQRGQAARMRWSLDSAEQQFRAAVDIDPRYPQAQLWLAQVMLWERPQAAREWGAVATRALVLREHLSARDTLLARGIVALSDGSYPAACAAYRAVRLLEPSNDLAWYGLGYCLGLDPITVRDQRSPSGWRFRASIPGAIAAFDSAVAMTAGAPGFAFQMLGSLVISEPLRSRVGRSDSSPTRQFYAVPSLIADSVALIPYPAAQVERGTHPSLATRSAALRRNVQSLEELYREWVRRAPLNGDAVNALAYVQELKGQPEALTTIERARSLSKGSLQTLTLDIARVRLLAKQARFADASQAARSILGRFSSPTAQEAEKLAGIAALIGDLSRAATLLGSAAAANSQSIFRSPAAVPAPVAGVATEFLVLASAGACGEYLKAFAPRLDRLILQFAPVDQSDELHRVTIARALSLSVPCLGPGVMTTVRDADPLVRMQQRLAAGQTKAVRVILDSLRLARTGLRPGDIALDHTYQEAWILLALGDSAAAIRTIDLPLTSLPTLTTHLLDDVPAAAALGRSLALRADLAMRAGDPAGAQDFARQALSLWGAPSAELQPDVRRMRRMAGTP